MSDDFTPVVRLKSALAAAEMRAGSAVPHGGFRFELVNDGILARLGAHSIEVPWHDIQHGGINPFPAYLDELLDRAGMHIRPVT